MKLNRQTTVRGLIAAGALLGLSACANPQADQALYAQSAFVGMPKQFLLTCAGVPTRSASVDNVDYYTYTSERLVTTPVPGPSFSARYGYYRPWSPWGWGFGFDDYPETETRDCQATFTLKDGIVQRIVYNSASDGQGARLGQCYRIVENCLAMVPQQQGQPVK